MGKHKEWRKIAKKMRRKRIRTGKARERDRLLKIEEERLKLSPRYQEWLRNQETLELFQEQEEERLSLENHRKWLEEEEAAQAAWTQRQIRIAQAKEEKEKQIMLLKEKFLKEETLKQEVLDKQNEEKKKAQLKQENMKKTILDYINGVVDELPVELSQISQSQPGKEDCPFFSKVGACRFFEMCSRNHKRPGVSKILLFQGLYSHFSLYNANRTKEYDTDISLEYDNTEKYTHFDEFYSDIIDEIKNIGKISLVKVCKNSEPHLRGNVYVQFKSERDALRVYGSLCGRYYAGKQLSPVFITIPSWKSALCGQQWNKRCHKGSLCNFLHVFSNPRGEFSRYDDVTSDSDSPNNRWSSESPEDSNCRSSYKSSRKRNRSTERFRKRSCSTERSRKRSHSTERSRKRSCSTERSRKRSQSTERSWKRSGSTRKRSRSSERSRKRSKSTNRSRKRSSSSERYNTERKLSQHSRKDKRSENSDRIRKSSSFRSNRREKNSHSSNGRKNSNTDDRNTNNFSDASPGEHTAPGWSSSDEDVNVTNTKNSKKRLKKSKKKKKSK